MCDDEPVADGPTPRQQARAANLERIKGLALQQLADSGAATLSLRAIARELNIVSSAIYRYYPGRDELITDLVIDAYGDLADQVEAATAGRRPPRRRWAATLPGRAPLGGRAAAPVRPRLRLRDPRLRRPRRPPSRRPGACAVPSSTAATGAAIAPALVPHRTGGHRGPGASSHVARPAGLARCGTGPGRTTRPC